MKTTSLLLISALAAIPAFASANTLWVSCNENPKETIGYAAAGTIYMPGSTSTGVSGAAFSTVTIGDVNGDGIPDIMAKLVAAGQGSDTPGTVVIGEDGGSGTTLWSVELDNAMVFKFHVFAVGTFKTDDRGPFTVTFVGPNPPTSRAYPVTGRRQYKPFSCAVSIPGIQDPTGVTDVSGMTVTFPSAVAPPNPAGTTGGPPPFVSDLSLSTPSSIDDGFSEWMDSVIQSGSDERQVSLNYTFGDGSSLELDLLAQLSGLDYTTTAKKNPDAPVKFYRLVFRP